jgi:hypothetical protein
MKTAKRDHLSKNNQARSFSGFAKLGGPTWLKSNWHFGSSWRQINCASAEVLAAQTCQK